MCAKNSNKLFKEKVLAANFPVPSTVSNFQLPNLVSSQLPSTEFKESKEKYTTPSLSPKPKILEMCKTKIIYFGICKSLLLCYVKA